MLNRYKICWMFAVVLGWTVNEAFPQTAPIGFRFHRNRDCQVLTADYWGTTGLRNAKLHELPRLECVNIAYGTDLTKDDIAYLSTLSSLKELIIGQDSADLPVAIEGDLSKLKNLTELEYLHLCIRDIKDSDLEFVASLQKLTHLELISGDSYTFGSNLTDRCGDYISDSKALRCIYFEGRANFTDGFVSKIANELPQLSKLNLNCPKLSDGSLRLLATHSKKLDTIEIRSNLITDAGVKHLAYASNLKGLRVYSKSLSKDCLLHDPQSNKLRSIELTIPTIDDAGVAVLARLKQLRSIVLRQTEFSDEQVLMFQDHPRLEGAVLQGSNLSEDAVLRLIGSIPNLERFSVGSKNPDLQALVNRTLLRKATKGD